MDTILVKDVRKKFKVYQDKVGSIKERLLFAHRKRYEERWVLDGIGFSVRKGEALGIIGENGSGKSTLLKLLTRIMYPDKGSIEIHGRVSSLIELGAGFHPDMSGRENIFTNASIFGLTKKQINNRLDEIIAFSELEEFIDNPVRTYSSGMYMRLAFSVAIHVNADILLIDEILAVGDAHFQEKCFSRLQEIKREGVSIVIVSHSLSQIEQICERSIWLEGGKIRVEGKPEVVHKSYLHYVKYKGQQDENKLPEAQPTVDDGNTILEVSISNQTDEIASIYYNGDPMCIAVRYLHTASGHQLMMRVIIQNLSHTVTYYDTNTIAEQIDLPDEPGEHILRFNISANYLMPDEYCVVAELWGRNDNISNHPYSYGIAVFSMCYTIPSGGFVMMPHTWEIL